MKSIKHLLLLFNLVFIGEISAQAPKIVAGINVDRVKRLEKFVQSEMDKGNIPGAVTMIVKVHFKKGGILVDSFNPMRADFIQ